MATLGSNWSLQRTSSSWRPLTPPSSLNFATAALSPVSTCGKAVTGLLITEMLPILIGPSSPPPPLPPSSPQAASEAVLQYGATKTGPAGMKSIIDGLAANFDLEVATTDTQLIGDDLVVQRFVGATFVNKRSGKRATMNVVEIYRFEDGLCVEQDNFYKSPEVIAEMIAEAGYEAP